MSTAALSEPLAPAYPDWPEVKERCVNVLCEGPSIEAATEADLLPGPVVAVNHALSLSGRFQIDFWATIDEPKNLWEWAQPYLPAACKLFTTENNLMFWLDYLGFEVASERLYAIKPTYMVATDEHPALLAENGNPALIPSVTHVVSWLYQIGVEHVRVFGADMCGSGSPLAFTPYSTDEDVGWQFRWAVERRLFALSTKKYREGGRRLERWVKRSTSTRNKSSLFRSAP